MADSTPSKRKIDALRRLVDSRRNNSKDEIVLLCNRVQNVFDNCHNTNEALKDLFGIEKWHARGGLTMAAENLALCGKRCVSGPISGHCATIWSVTL